MMVVNYWLVHFYLTVVGWLINGELMVNWCLIGGSSTVDWWITDSAWLNNRAGEFPFQLALPHHVQEIKAQRYPVYHSLVGCNRELPPIRNSCCNMIRPLQSSSCCSLVVDFPCYKPCLDHDHPSCCLLIASLISTNFDHSDANIARSILLQKRASKSEEKEEQKNEGCWVAWLIGCLEVTANIQWYIIYSRTGQFKPCLITGKDWSNS